MTDNNRSLAKRSSSSGYRPLVSIVTPVLNGSKYLNCCVQSVLAQTYPHIEQIFVDGGSTDGTLKMLESYQASFPERIRFISGRDVGVGDAINKGLKIAKGEVFGWLDSDDLYEPGAIEAVIEFFKSTPDANFVFGDCYRINESGDIVAKHPVKDWNYKEAVRDRHYVVFCAAFYKRRVIEKIGYFNSLGNDLDFWLRVAEEFQLYRLNVILSRFRRHSDSISASPSARARSIDRQRYKEDYLLCRKYGGSIFSPRVKRYAAFLILDKLGLYLFVSTKVLPKLRKTTFTRYVLKILGD